jgi:hypothetical protein
MNTLKRLACATVFFPLLSFAALEATFEAVTPACYRAIKTNFHLLPLYAEEFGFGISNMNTPSENPSTYTFTVDYSPTGAGVGDYGLYQQYSNKKYSLFLRFDQYPDSFPVEKADEIWKGIAVLVSFCPIFEQN